MNQTRSVETRIDDPSLAGTRLDVFLSETLGLFSRSQGKARIVELRVNGAPARLGRRIKNGDTIFASWSDPPAMTLTAQDIPLSILFENRDVVVIDKRQGMVVHPGNGNPDGTLVNALLFHCGRLAEEFAEGDPRPGIVHRLDKETSGVIIVAKNTAAHEELSAQFRARSVRKRYIAIVAGRLPAAEGRIETRLARDPRDRKRFACTEAKGRIAVTRYRVMRSFDDYALVSLHPRTGRTHQLRVHMRHLTAPILGDSLYGKRDPRFPDATLMLHARSLSIRLPGESEPRTFTAPIPSRFRSVIQGLQSSSPR